MIDEEPCYVIKGLRARPILVWRDNLLGPVLLTFYWFGIPGVGEVLQWFIGALVIFLLARFVNKLARGRIELFSGRLRIRSWNDSFRRALTVRLSEIGKVAVSGSTVRIGYVADGQGRHTRINVLAPVAEEFYDRILEQMDDDPELRDRIEEQGARRFVIRPRTE